ncbi:MAG: hypothetical protein CME70_11455 [Halobacteriovorax sp.]|nr:hypothetical protein [Halobacteriovorax sp.]|tara:strand:+ start:65003 stop:65275 length:273 start_codon:yes stop_codon:yes gene_type:complete
MKLVLLTILSLFIVSCAHHHKEPEHHHHQYMKQCAYSVSHGKMNVEGKEEYKTEHDGKTYFFSSKEKKKKFDTDIAKNITKANKYWSRRR